MIYFGGVSVNENSFEVDPYIVDGSAQQLSLKSIGKSCSPSVLLSGQRLSKFYYINLSKND